MRLSIYSMTLLTLVMTAASAVYAHDNESEEEEHTHSSKEQVEISYSKEYGRSAAEYFFTPIIGINYTDVTTISASFVNSDTKSISYNNSGGNSNLNVNNTEISGTVGFLMDGQYQIVSSSYWRAGFQTGLVYDLPSKSEFMAELCDGVNNSGCLDSYLQEGSLTFSSLNLPVMFTYSRYAAQDEYIVTAKLGPVVTYNWYDLDFDGFTEKPDHETQVLFSAGIDGRYRIDEDNFLLVGFLATDLFGNNNNFSGVDQFGNFSVYLGWSFS